MPLGALTAPSLSTAMIQFVDFARKLVSKGYKIYKATEGTLLEYSELDITARKLVPLNYLITETYDDALKEDSYRSGGSIPLDSEAQLRDVCRGCSATAEKLVTALERLKSLEKRSKWESFRQAFKSLRGKDRVLALKNQLDVYRDNLNTTLLLSLKNNHFVWQRNLVEDIDKNELRHDRAGDVAQFGHHLSQAAIHGVNPQLESNNNLHYLCWITGKPGSGKSTLMKLIVMNLRTRQHLDIWSREQPLIIASFYFWNSGSKTQMSEGGMLRTILYEALSQWPTWIAELFPSRWATSNLIGADSTPWAVEELRSALDTFVKGCHGIRKLCLFVDGLYLSVKGVKCCLASRPWPVLEDAFCKSASLMLQELTFNDILVLAKDKAQDEKTDLPWSISDWAVKGAAIEQDVPSKAAFASKYKE
ncbi:Nn.00g090580.m01.CDS01 [Neocucurbitaria sp. VM-36]